MISFEPATLGPAVDVMASPSGADLDDLAALVREAGWNQIAADWRMLIEVGSVFAVRSKEGRIVATLAMLPYGSRFAWLSQLLVAGSYRRIPAGQPPAAYSTIAPPRVSRLRLASIRTPLPSNRTIPPRVRLNRESHPIASVAANCWCEACQFYRCAWGWRSLFCFFLYRRDKLLRVRRREV